MAGEFWFSERQWAVIAPLLPSHQPGARRGDDRRVLSGIVHMLRSDARWQACPAVYAPPTTIYNRFQRWSRRGLWQRMLQALAVAEPGDVLLIDSTSVKAHRSAAGAKGGQARTIGHSRGGRTTKIHAVVDGQGRSLTFTLNAGQRGDAPPAPSLLQTLRAARVCAADTACDSDALRQLLLARGTLPVVTDNPTRKRRHPFV